MLNRSKSICYLYSNSSIVCETEYNCMLLQSMERSTLHTNDTLVFSGDVCNCMDNDAVKVQLYRSTKFLILQEFDINHGNYGV